MADRFPGLKGRGVLTLLNLITNNFTEVQRRSRPQVLPCSLALIGLVVHSVIVGCSA